MKFPFSKEHDEKEDKPKGWGVQFVGDDEQVIPEQ